MFLILLFITSVFVVNLLCTHQKPFETTFCVILITPIVAHGIEIVNPIGYLQFTLLNSIAFIFSYLAVLKTKIFVRNDDENTNDYVMELTLFIVFYLGIYILLGFWAEFYPIGERLRDLAILGAVIDAPGYGVVEEPWFKGYIINYYLYWFRLSKFFNILDIKDIATLYRLIITFSFSFFIISVYCCFYRFIRIGRFRSLIYTCVICFGSNLAGILSVFWKNDHWWAPSRTITGGITEFPSWTLLLGDAHPHLLNSGVIPFLLLILHSISRIEERMCRCAAFLCFMFIIVMFEYNANAWEAPVAAMLCLCFFITTMISSSKSALETHLNPTNIIFAGTLCFLCAVGLTAWAQNVAVDRLEIRVLTSDIASTTLGEFLNHWGIFFGIVLLCWLTSRTKAIERAIIILALIVGIMLNHTGFFVILFICGIIWEILPVLKFSCRNFYDIAPYLTGIVGLLCLFVPEVVFIDDAYVGEFERINTIFKYYFIAWFCLGFYTLSGYHRTIASNIRKHRISFKLGEIAVFLVMLSFFVQAVPVRADHRPNMGISDDELSVVSGVFAGAREIIAYLREMPRGVVLEASEGSYDWTSHVATFSGQPAYLGWQNHLNFFYGHDNNISRRYKIIGELYSSESCLYRKALAQKEGITYIIYGPLERKRYGEVDNSCMTSLYTIGEYQIFSNS